MDMKERYERFGKLLEEERIFEEPALTFAEVCRRMGVPPDELDVCIFAETGLRGEEVLQVYRESEKVSEYKK